MKQSRMQDLSLMADKIQRLRDHMDHKVPNLTSLILISLLVSFIPKNIPKNRRKILMPLKYKNQASEENKMIAIVNRNLSNKTD